MNKYLIAALLLVCVGPLFAKGPSKKFKADLAALTAGATQQIALDAAQTKKAEQAKAAAAKQDQDAEESVVMIDSKGETDADAEETGSAAANGAEQEERTVPGGLPSSYGQCKGVINDGGRNIMIFESIDDGSLSFVQLIAGKSAVSWKLISRIPRSAD